MSRLQPRPRDSTAATLGERIAHREEGAFVGRSAEITDLEALFVPDPPANVAFVHGPAGIGKSTLLREAARRAVRRGWHPSYVEGRELAPSPDALEDALADVRDHERPLIVLDSYERVTALGSYLRRALLPTLPSTTILLIGSRHAPEGAWFREGWQRVLREIELGPLTAEEGTQLLGAYGVHEAALVRNALAWAGGSPLALALAAEGARPRPGAATPAGPRETARPRALLLRLAEAELDSPHVSALNVAAIARITTPELLRDAIPEVDAAEAYRWLETRSFVEPLGGGLALHDLVRRAVREDLRQREPERGRELRRRIADHLYARGTLGDRLLSMDLADLIESPLLRWGFSWRDSSRYRVDDVRPDDREAIAMLLRKTRHVPYWIGTQRFFEETPEHVAVARDVDDQLCGYTVAVAAHSAPSFCVDDPLLGPWLEHAMALSPRGDVVLYRDSVDFTVDPESDVIGMLGMAGMLRSALENPRYAYAPVNPRMPGATEFVEAVGGTHHPELDVAIGGLAVQCYVIDYGPGGLLAAQRDLVYRELGLPPPKVDPAPAAVDFLTVRHALRNLRVPQALARSPLASGETVEDRAESVRSLLRDAADAAFGDDDRERLLRRVLTRGYVDPAPSHELAAEELHMSRSAYFRRLRTATARVTDYVAQRMSQ